MKHFIHLHQLEQQIPEGLYAYGERHLAEGRIELLREVDKNLWQAKVRMEQIHEVEMLIQGNRIKAFSCDCTAGQRKRLCSHVAGCLILLRRHRQQQKENKKAAQPKTVPLTTTRILPHVEPGQLQQFTKEWASKHPEFAMAFKARFFLSLDQKNPTQYIDQLFDPYTDYEGKLDPEPTNQRAIMLLFEQIALQITPLLSNGHPEKAYHIGRYLIHLIFQSPAIPHSSNLVKKVLDATLTLPDPNDLNPDGDRFHFLLEITNPLFEMRDEAALYRVMHQLQGYGGFAKARKRILAQTKELLTRTQTTSTNLDQLLFIYYQHLPVGEKSGPWLSMLHLSRITPLTYQFLAKKLIANKDMEEAYNLLENALSTYPHHLELLRLQRDILSELHMQEELTQVLYAIILHGLKHEDLQQAKNVLSDKFWKKMVVPLEADLQDLPYSYDRNEILGALYALNENWPALQSLVATSQSLRLWRFFAPIISTKEPKRLASFCLSFLKDYLDHHLGPRASSSSDEVLSFLKTNGSSKDFLSCLNHIKASYPDRPVLWEHYSHLRTRQAHEN